MIDIKESDYPLDIVPKLTKGSHMSLTKSSDEKQRKEAFDIYQTKVAMSGHILDLNCVHLSNDLPFCENYAKLYFDAKH